MLDFEPNASRFFAFKRRRLIQALANLGSVFGLSSRNAERILLVSIRLAQLATSRLADSFRGEFVHLSDLVCVVRLIA